MDSTITIPYWFYLICMVALGHTVTVILRLAWDLVKEISNG